MSLKDKHHFSTKGESSMIIYLLLQGLDAVLFFVVSLFPTIETPAYLVTSLPQILRTVMGFNLYLPIYEGILAVILCIGFTVGFRVFSIIVSKAGLSV